MVSEDSNTLTFRINSKYLIRSEVVELKPLATRDGGGTLCTGSLKRGAGYFVRTLQEIQTYRHAYTQI